MEQLPDISVQPLSKNAPKNAAEHPVVERPLHRVGMRGIELPVVFGGMRIAAHVDAFVSLDQADVRGIHMSRLYREANLGLSKNPLRFTVLRKILDQFLETHVGLSSTASLSAAFDWAVERKALLSAEVGWRTYPLKFSATKDVAGQMSEQIDFEVLYSSTCPCSAALARQLHQEAFSKAFPSQTVSSSEVRAWLGTESSAGGVAHAQRSRARVSLRLGQAVATRIDEHQVLDFIDGLEKALGTPVQSAVKRVDEQEFARLNAENLMFCEDAARKAVSYIAAHSDILDFRVEVRHEESLHPHDAVAVVVKGVAGGFVS
jgi:GTP cyclohydrolase IB